jgi:hypothetical protein
MAPINIYVLERDLSVVIFQSNSSRTFRLHLQLQILLTHQFFEPSCLLGCKFGRIYDAAQAILLIWRQVTLNSYMLEMESGGGGEMTTQLQYVAG